MFAVHPGQLKTAVAPADADINPEEAALKLYEWVEKTDENLGCGCYDLMSGAIIGW